MRLAVAVAAGLIVVLAATSALAETMNVYGWAYHRSTGTVYVTDSVMGVDRYDRVPADQRLLRALQREGVQASDLSARHVGAALDSTMTPGDAEADRRTFIDRERSRGANVRVVDW